MEEGTLEAVEKCKGAKVERWTGRISGRVDQWTGGMENKGTSGRVDWWARRTGGRDTGISANVQRCKGGKVKTSGPVGEWTSGRGGGKRAQEMQCKGANVQRWEGEDKWTGRISGRVDKWERKRQEAVEKCKGAKVER
ncbi:hypothetical protein EBR11_06560 [bacterium]|nr:hypothetical protein [bacterium]